MVIVGGICKMYTNENGFVYYSDGQIKQLIGNFSKVDTERINETTVEDVTVTFDLEVGGYVETSRVTRADSEPLDVVKQRKLDELTNACHAALETFTSSALSTPHTYLSRANSIPNDMLLLSSEYTFVKGDDYDLQPITWYTVEEGNMSHTKAQIVQVYLDARTNVATQMYHRATLEYQVNACTTIDDVNAIVW
jgi:hypothetical protein